MMMKTPEPEGGDARPIHHDLFGQHRQRSTVPVLSAIVIYSGLKSVVLVDLKLLLHARVEYQAGVCSQSYHSVM